VLGPGRGGRGLRVRLVQGLRRLPGVEAVRGAGLLLAARLEAPVAKEAASRALEHGLLVNAVLPDAIRVAPPLLVTGAEIDAALAILDAALAAVVPAAPPTAGE